MKLTEVNALEYEALLNLDRMVRLAMTTPNTGEFLVVALQALDKVRLDEGLTIPENPPEIVQPEPIPLNPKVSSLAAALIERAKKE